MVRTFITCDVCNPNGELVNSVNQERGVYRGSQANALGDGWKFIDRDVRKLDQQHICLDCQEEGR